MVRKRKRSVQKKMRRSKVNNVNPSPKGTFPCYVNFIADVFARNKRIQGNNKFVHFGKLLTGFVRVSNNSCTTDISEVIFTHCYQS